MKKTALLLLLISSTTFATGFVPKIDISLESESDRNDERQVSSYGTELNIESLFIEIGPLSLGAFSKFTHEVEREEGPATRFNSFGPKFSLAGDLTSSLTGELSYSYHFVKDRDLNERDLVDSYHTAGLNLTQSFFQNFELSLFGEVIHYMGDLPELYDSPHNELTAGFDLSYAKDSYSVGTSVEWRQESIYRQRNGHKNVVYDRVVVIPHVSKEFESFNAELFAVLSPFRREYNNVIANDTIKEANFGFNLSTSLEWK